MINSLVDYSDEEIEAPGQISIINRIHMVGFYPSFCKIDVSSQLFHIKQCPEYHISLSLSFQLNHHQIKDFVTQLQSEADLISPFLCTLEEQSTLFVNQATNKQYAVLLVDTNKEKMNQLIQVITKQISGFDPLYQIIPMIPHCTIRDHPFKTAKQIHIKVSEFEVVIGKEKNKIKLN